MPMSLPEIWDQFEVGKTCLLFLAPGQVQDRCPGARRRGQGLRPCPWRGSLQAGGKETVIPRKLSPHRVLIRVRGGWRTIQLRREHEGRQAGSGHVLTEGLRWPQQEGSGSRGGARGGDGPAPLGGPTRAQSRGAVLELGGCSGWRNFVFHLPFSWRVLTRHMLMFLRMFPQGGRSWWCGRRGVKAGGCAEVGGKKLLGALNSGTNEAQIPLQMPAVFLFHFSGDVTCPKSHRMAGLERSAKII